MEVDITDTGMVSVTAKNQETGKAAIAFITALLKDIEPGEMYTGKALKILEGVGVIVDLGSGKSGMVHISKIAKERVENIEHFVKIGDMVTVKVLTVDKEKGRIGLERIIAE